MTERIRLIIDTEEEIRLAVKLEASRTGQSTSEVVNGILRKILATQIQDAKKYTPSKRHKEE